MKLQKPKIPHIKLECVALCGLGGVGGMIAPIQFQIFKKYGTLLDKPPFLALERCVEYYYFQTVWTSRYTLKQPYAVAFGTSLE
jgi:hypothetical protein